MDILIAIVGLLCAFGLGFVYGGRKTHEWCDRQEKERADEFKEEKEEKGDLRYDINRAILNGIVTPQEAHTLTDFLSIGKEMEARYYLNFILKEDRIGSFEGKVEEIMAKKRSERNE